MTNNVPVSASVATSQLTSPKPDENWRAKAFVVGGVAGILFGLVSAYFYTRGAEDTVRAQGVPAKAEPGDIIGLLLAGLTITRQIAEMGRSNQKQKK